MKSDPSHKSIAVTDALGLLGPAVIRELLSANHYVRALLSPDETMPPEWTKHPRLKMIRGEVLNPVSLQQLMEGVDAVVHTAQLFSFQAKNKSRMRVLHIDGTSQVVNTAMDNSVSKFIHLSSTEALGHGDQRIGDGLRMKWDEDGQYSILGRTLFHSELQVWRAQAEGLPVVILRPSYILGACPRSNPIADWLEQVVQGLPFFPTGSTGWVDAGDVARAVRLSLSPQFSGQAWVLNAANASYKFIIDQLSEACGTRPPIKPLGETLSPFIAAWNRLRGLWSADASWLAKESLQLSRLHSKYDGSTAAAELGLAYRPLKESIAELAKSFDQKDWQGQPQLFPNQ